MGGSTSHVAGINGIAVICNAGGWSADGRRPSGNSSGAVGRKSGSSTPPPSNADRQGLSFYSDATIAVRLRLREATVVAAREQLLIHDLVAYRPPLTQVLSLPQGRIQRGGGLQAIGELFRALQSDVQEREP